MWPNYDPLNVIMRRRREFYILNCCNTVLTAIVFFVLIGEWKFIRMVKHYIFYFSLIVVLPLLKKKIWSKINFPDANDLPDNQTELFVSPTETFDNTGMSKDNESMGVEEVVNLSSTNSPLVTSQTATQVSTPLPQNRFFVATDRNDQHITVPSEITAASYNTTSTNSTKFGSTNNMTSSYDSRNSSNTSYSIRVTTMKPCKQRWTIIDKVNSVELTALLMRVRCCWTLSIMQHHGEIINHVWIFFPLSQHESHHASTKTSYQPYLISHVTV